MKKVFVKNVIIILNIVIRTKINHNFILTKRKAIVFNDCVFMDSQKKFPNNKERTVLFFRAILSYCFYLNYFRGVVYGQFHPHATFHFLSRLSVLFPVFHGNLVENWCRLSVEPHFQRLLPCTVFRIPV